MFAFLLVVLFALINLMDLTTVAPPLASFMEWNVKELKGYILQRHACVIKIGTPKGLSIITLKFQQVHSLPFDVPKTDESVANSVDPDQMPHSALFVPYVTTVGRDTI